MVLRRVFCALAVAGAVSACSHRQAVVEEPQSQLPPPQASAAPSEPSAPASAWTYEGEKGPASWAAISPEFSQCQGKKQSPVNLAYKKPTKKGPRLDFSYTSSSVTADLSTPIPQLKYNGGNQLLLNGKVYNLDRVEFHSPSEHQLSKNSLSMEIQFHHKALNGGHLATVSVLAIEGRDNPLLGEVWSNMIGGTHTFQFDAGKLIPPNKTFYAYTGSLTSPPCTEGVEWIVFNTPVELSQQQIIAFRSKFPANSRPLQPVNGRKVLNY